MNQFAIASEKCLQVFEDMPQKAKELFFAWMLDIGSRNSNISYLFRISFCESPIEQIFLVALLYVSDTEGCFEIANHIEPQVEIMTANRNRVDFLLCSEDIEVGESAVYEPFELVIECDGHDFHSSKEQIAKDNERDLDMKIAGYDVIRFSGTQIYKDPCSCARMVLSYIQSRAASRKRKPKGRGSDYGDIP